MNNYSFWIYTLFSGGVFIALYYYMIDIMREKGVYISKYSKFPPFEWYEFYKILKQEENSKKKTNYQIILWLQIILSITYILMIVNA